MFLLKYAFIFCVSLITAEVTAVHNTEKSESKQTIEEIVLLGIYSCSHCRKVKEQVEQISTPCGCDPVPYTFFSITRDECGKIILSKEQKAQIREKNDTLLTLIEHANTLTNAIPQVFIKVKPSDNESTIWQFLGVTNSIKMWLDDSSFNNKYKDADSI